MLDSIHFLQERLGVHQEPRQIAELLIGIPRPSTSIEVREGGVQLQFESVQCRNLQFIVSHTLKKASCLHYYHISIDLHDNLYARPHPACSLSACSVEKAGCGPACEAK